MDDFYLQLDRIEKDWKLTRKEARSLEEHFRETRERNQMFYDTAWVSR